MLANLFQLFFLQISISFVDGIYCYACTTSLSSAVDNSGQLGLRMLLNANYNLPKVHALCHNSDDVMFQTIPKEDCGDHNECMKVSAENAGLKFIIRGCSSKLFKINARKPDLQCVDGSPSICNCNTNACNPGIRTSVLIFPGFITIFTFFLLK